MDDCHLNHIEKKILKKNNGEFLMWAYFSQIEGDCFRIDILTQFSHSSGLASRTTAAVSGKYSPSGENIPVVS